MKILITDDDELMRDVYKRYFETKGHQTIECLNMETLQKEGPSCDLVLADYETYVRFEDVIKLGKPTVLASGNPGMKYEYTLVKPFTIKELEQMINKVI